MRRLSLTHYSAVVGLLCVALAAALAGCGKKETVTPTTPPSTTSKAQPVLPPDPQAEPLSDSSGQAMDLTAPEDLAKTWVARVSKCDIKADNGSLVCDVVGGSDTSGGQYGGLRLKLGSVKAVRVDVTFTNPENIVGAFADLTVGSKTKPRLRWELMAKGGVRVPSGEQSFTFRAKQNTGFFRWAGGDAAMDKVDHLHFFIRVKAGSAAGFRIHRILVER